MSGYNSLLTLSGSEIWGYRLSQLVGSGSYGAVYRASSGSDTIAVKISCEEQDLAIEALTLQLFYYRNAVPKFHFCNKYGPYHTIGMELLSHDMDSIWQKVDWMAFERPTLIKFIYQALTCLEAVHALKIVHRDVKLSNFAITQPRTPGNQVSVRILDFGLSHVYADADGNLRDDSRSFDFSKMKYAAYDASLGCDPMPKDDICQLGYAVMYAAGFDFAQQLKLPADDLSNWKGELIRDPANNLPLSVKFMLPFFELVADLNDVVPIKYDLLKQRIQECLPEVDATCDSILSEENGKLTLT
ncbi:Protein CBG07264 [Caenorhabditis briggsae]|uniref:Protein CBG07264 n=1 Tax=Caenorhabditis briggsae TaxID=6238 RepID=A8X539_CAEBR|nr:Protein CBG07264 [Caenorhabditis briggsae]CAP27750.1 Protein CBG07264 [Caenorhabditis briggsae]